MWIKYRPIFGAGSLAPEYDERYHELPDGFSQNDIDVFVDGITEKYTRNPHLSYVEYDVIDSPPRAYLLAEADKIVSDAKQLLAIAQRYRALAHMAPSSSGQDTSLSS